MWTSLGERNTILNRNKERGKRRNLSVVIMC